jgi:hypothetical protein
MTPRRAKKSTTRTRSLEPLLGVVAKKLTDCRALKKGTILVRATGAAAADYYLDCAPEGVRLVKGTGRLDTPPVIEIIGDTRQIHGVLKGETDALKRFLAGGFRVRGDLRYFSDLAFELGVLKNPL